MCRQILLRNGADEVIYPEKQVANWAAIRYTADHIRDYIEVGEAHAIFEVEVPKGWIGKTVGELDIRRKYSINIMATKENGKINMAVSPETVFTDRSLFGSRCLQRTAKVFSHLTEVNEDG